MNIHGLKRKAKSITALLQNEERRPHPNKDKIHRLKVARRRLQEQIRRLKRENKKQKKMEKRRWRKNRN